MTKASSAKSTLAKYRAKRNLAETPEPEGKKAVPTSSKLRFVIQRHDAKRLHYDFRLELDGVFKSWAVTRGPSLDPHDKRLAVEVEDHPLDYGDFEGTIPKGQYGGGTVQLWDRGYWIPEGVPHDGLKRGNLKFSLEGERLLGGWVLVRMKKDRTGGKRTNWLLIKHRDDAAREGDGDALLKDPKSIASGRSLDAIAAGKGKAPTSFITRKPKEEIGAEVHRLDQFFRVEEGTGEAILDGVRTVISAGFAVLVPAGTKHNIINTSSVPLKLYTLYAPPNHRDGVVHHTRAEAEKDNEHFDGKTTE